MTSVYTPAQEAVKCCRQHISVQSELNPAKAALQKKAAVIARRCANLIGSKKGFIVYDGTSLVNNGDGIFDLPIIIEQKLSKSSIEDRLGQLTELKSKNLISEEEYDRRCCEILDEV